MPTQMDKLGSMFSIMHRIWGGDIILGLPIPNMNIVIYIYIYIISGIRLYQKFELCSW